MSIPDGMLTVQLSIHSYLPDGGARVGVFTFTPIPNYLSSSADDAFISGSTSVSLGGGGTAFVNLVATDETSVEEFIYRVDEYYDGIRSRSYYIAPTSANDGSDLTDIDKVSGPGLTVDPP